jgi:hypothetical protein
MTSRMNYSSRFYLYAPLALLLLVGAAAGLHWWQVERRLEARLDALQAGEAMPGVTVRYATRSIGGFPFRIDAVFTGMRVAVATGNGPAIWRAEHFALHALTYGRDETIFEAGGRQRLEWTDDNARPHHLDFETGATHASVIRDGRGILRFDLDLMELGSSAFTAARLQFHARRVAAENRIDIFATGDNLRLSPRLRGAFGGEIKMISLQGTASAASAFEGLRAGRTDWRSAVEAWRNAAGVLHVDPIEINWGGLDMIGHGAMALDTAHRPQGIVDFKVAGMAGWLARNPPMRPNGIAAALRDRAAKAGSDGGGRMGVVYGIKDSVVYVGEVPVGTAEPLY